MSSLKVKTLGWIQTQVAEFRFSGFNVTFYNLENVAKLREGLRETERERRGIVIVVEEYMKVKSLEKSETFYCVEGKRASFC
jgi:hypothetical protein